MTESSYINRLENRPYRSTIKTLPATLPEPWTTVRGPRSKRLGPRSTDLEPRIVGLGSRFKPRVPKASPLTRSRSESRKTRLYDRGARNVVLGPRTGVTGVVWEIWIELGRGAGCGFGALAARTLGGDGSVKAAKSSFVWMGCKVQILTAWLGASGSAVPALICSITILLST